MIARRVVALVVATVGLDHLVKGGPIQVCVVQFDGVVLADHRQVAAVDVKVHGGDLIGLLDCHNLFHAESIKHTHVAVHMRIKQKICRVVVVGKPFHRYDRHVVCDRL